MARLNRPSGRSPYADEATMKSRTLTWFTTMALLVLAIPVQLAAQEQQPAQPSTGVIQTQETNQEGVVGELTECQRSEGVLTIKVRFRNTSSKSAHLTLTHWNVGGDNEKFYVTAGNKKYFILKDSEGTYLSSNSASNGVEVSLEPGHTFLWWAKYSAPPADVKKINFMMPVTPPFEGVPITDK
jgi:hypothetical protein